MAKYRIVSITGTDVWNGLKTALGGFEFEANDNLTKEEMYERAELECEMRHCYDYTNLSFERVVKVEENG